MNRLWIPLAILGAGAILLIARHDSGDVLGIDNDRFASLIYLSALGLVISAAVVSGRTRWREAARNVVLWLGIIVVLMAGYVYRFELQDIGARISGGLIPGSPVALDTVDGRERLVLLRTISGHFEARAQANGRTLSMLVDTGASVIVLSADDARRAGIDVDSLTFSAPVTTANGRTTAAPVLLDELAVGDIRRERIAALVARPGALETSLLGMNFLSSLTSFEFRADRLILTD